MQVHAGDWPEAEAGLESVPQATVVATIGSALAAVALRAEFEARRSRGPGATRQYEVVELERVRDRVGSWERGVVILVSPVDWRADVETLAWVARQNPRLDLMATADAVGDPQVLLRLAEVGVRLFISTATPVEGWADLVECIGRGFGPVLEAGLGRALSVAWPGPSKPTPAGRSGGLTPKSREIMHLVLQGKSPPQIAAALRMAPQNVRRRIRAIRDRAVVR